MNDTEVFNNPYNFIIISEPVTRKTLNATTLRSSCLPDTGTIKKS